MPTTPDRSELARRFLACDLTSPEYEALLNALSTKNVKVIDGDVAKPARAPMQRKPPCDGMNDVV